MVMMMNDDDDDDGSVVGDYGYLSFGTAPILLFQVFVYKI